jgi:hypothetical protein
MSKTNRVAQILMTRPSFHHQRGKRTHRTACPRQGGAELISAGHMACIHDKPVTGILYLLEHSPQFLWDKQRVRSHLSAGQSVRLRGVDERARSQPATTVGAMVLLSHCVQAMSRASCARSQCRSQLRRPVAGVDELDLARDCVCLRVCNSGLGPPARRPTPAGCRALDSDFLSSYVGQGSLM